VKCPGRDELAAWLDRELPERRAADVAEHVAACTVCTATVKRLERLVGELRAPAIPHADAARVARTMARLDEPAPRRSRLWIGGAALAMAAAAIAVVWIRPGHDGTFTARGGGDRSLEREVGATVYTLASSARPLAPETEVAAETAFVVGFRDLPSAPAVWALAFAVDVRHDVHWLYPAYTARSDDPLAVPLVPGAGETLMPDAAVLDHVARGPMRIVVMIAPAQLRVSAIETLHGDELSLAALRARFPAAVISELRVVVR
jgi:ferric-dicitrate binding protein FerR (iron transport regulator)